MRVVCRAPGRVNLIGDHTDYTGGLVLPLAIDRGTTVAGKRGGNVIRLRSTADHREALVPLNGPRSTPSAPWARYVDAVAEVIRPSLGLEGRVTTTLPIGAGLASSAALEVALALALGFEGNKLELALACQHAEQMATGVPCGVMDQLISAAGLAGHAVLIDCTNLSATPVPLPCDVEIAVVHSGQTRRLVDSAYSERRAACEIAARLVGPLREATVGDLASIDDPAVRRRARHVVSENQRVRSFVSALTAGQAEEAGHLMTESHRSLRDDFEVSTPALDALVEHLLSLPGVLGARLTGAGFGGCAVALIRPDSALEAWRVRAVDGACVEYQV